MMCRKAWGELVQEEGETELHYSIRLRSIFSFTMQAPVNARRSIYKASLRITRSPSKLTML